MKIMIIGFSGSGKSTLAKTLAVHYQIPVLYMDTLNFASGWVERKSEVRNQDLLHFLESHDQWVIDGNYQGAYFKRRAEEADQIIYLSYNRFVCFYNAFIRYLKFRHKSRESMTLGCDEKLDWEFIRWLLIDGRMPKRVSGFKTICQTYQDKALIFKNRRQLKRYLQSKNIQYLKP